MMLDKISWKFWTNEYLGNDISFDTETELIRGPSHKPRIALTTAYGTGNTAYVIKNDDCLEFFEKHKESNITAHNFSFDNSVIKENFGLDLSNKITESKVLDTAILYRLLGIAKRGYKPFKYSLALIYEKIFKEKLDKDLDIRLTFGEYINYDGSVRYEDIPEEHYKYAALDAYATQKIKEVLLKKISELPTSTNLSHDIQLMGEVALYDIHSNGIEVDLKYATDLRNKLQEDMDKNSAILETYGLTRGKGFHAKYTEIVNKEGLKLPLTGKTKRISMKAEHLEKYRGNPFVDALLDYLEVEHRKNFLNLLIKRRVHPRYDSIKNTLRTGCSNPNIQNPPREGGIRQAFIAKEGYVLVDIDYSSIELYALAYICKKKYGSSTLYNKLNNDADIHIYAASKIFNKEEADVKKEERQIAKIANYGLAANMGGTTFQKHMASNGVNITIDRALEIKNLWMKAFPEIEIFWKEAQGKQALVTDTGFIRNHCSYTAYLNTQFQSAAADGAKLALFNIMKAGYKIVAFVHDQVVIECKEEEGNKTLDSVSELMVESMKVRLPGMNIKVEGKITKRYEK